MGSWEQLPQDALTAWALRCFEIWLQRKHIIKPWLQHEPNQLDNLLNHLWTSLETDYTNFAEWEASSPKVEITAVIALAGEHQDAMTEVVEAAIGLVFDQLYAAYDAELHRRNASTIFRHLVETGRTVPDPQQFAPPGSTWQHDNMAVPKEIISTWRSVQPTLDPNRRG